MRAGLLVVAVLVLAGCVGGQQTAYNPNDCRYAPDPAGCSRQQREAVEERENQQARWERERRAVDNPESGAIFPSRRDGT